MNKPLSFILKVVGAISLAAILASCNPKEEEVASVSLNPYILSLVVGNTSTISVSVDPPSLSSSVTWSSSNPNVATVSNGTVTALASGSTTISVSVGGKTATCALTVSQPVQSISLDKTQVEIEEDHTLQLTVTISPSNADEQDVTWSSTQSSIAWAHKGLITAVSAGKVTITAQVGDKTATCEVTVTESESKKKERAALVAFYKANNGDNWTEVHRENWCTDKPVATWYGVSSSDDLKHVLSLAISDDNLYGTLPKEITDLTELRTLNLIGRRTSYEGAGPIPENIGSLKKLKRLVLSFYPVTGTIPKSLTDLTDLEYLAITASDDMSPQEIPAGISKLTKLADLSLNRINITGSIPSEIGNLTNLEHLRLDSNDLTGTIPASFANLKKLNYIDLSGNKLSGPIPPELNNLENFWYIWCEMFRSNNFTQEDIRKVNIPAPKSPLITCLSGKKLNIEELINKNKYTVFARINPLSGDAVEFLSQLSAIYKSNKDKGLGVTTYIDNSRTVEYDNEERVALDEQFKSILKKCGAEWESFVWYMSDNYTDGAPFYTQRGYIAYPSGKENDVVIIGPDKTVVYTTTIDSSRNCLNNALAYLLTVLDANVSHYESKSYTQDGKYETLQKASTGKGVDLVITGDAFSDRLISDGTFKKAAQQAMKDFFSVEPMKSMKSRFNVYLVYAVSKHEEYFSGNSTVFEGNFGYGSAVGGKDKKVLEYAKKAVKDNTRMDNAVVLVMMNSVRSGGTSYMSDPSDKSIYAGGNSVCWIPYKDVTVSGGVSSEASVIIHEVAGHGLGKLADEYSYSSSGKVPSEEIDYIRKYQKLYWYMNVDFTSDPKKVLWSQFIGDNAFASENIGVYEGGDTFSSGVWRPTEQSVMNDNNNHSTFNAPCRSQLYTRIMKLSEGSSWTYKYSDFVTWDKAHPTTTRAATRSIVEVDDDAPVHVPPIHVHKTWEEVIEGR